MAQHDHGFALSAEEFDQFQRDGFIGPFDLYTEAEMAQHLRQLRPKLINVKTAVYGGPRETDGVTDLAAYDRHLDVEFLARHITRPEIVDRVASILGPDVLCWRSEFFPKYPGDEGTDWHQADNFSSVDGGNKPQLLWPQDAGFGGTINVWTAFTPATEDTACLQFMPGTHGTMHYDESKPMAYDPGHINQREKQGTRRGFFGYDYRQLQKDPDWRPDESQAVSQVMRPGQFIIFWSLLMHASRPHLGTSDEMRLGYGARYVPTSVRVYPYSETLAEFGGTADLSKFGNVLVSGRDEYRHNAIAEQTVTGYRFPVRGETGRA